MSIVATTILTILVLSAGSIGLIYFGAWHAGTADLARKLPRFPSEAYRAMRQP